MWPSQFASYELMFRGITKKEADILNFMGYVFQYKDEPIALGLLPNIPHPDVDIQFSPPLTFVYDEEKLKETFQVLKKSTPRRLWAYANVGDREIVIPNLTAPASEKALLYIEESKKNLDCMFVIPISLRGDHMNMLILHNNSANYFEPHNIAKFEKGDNVPYGFGKEYLAKHHNINFHEDLSCPKLVWQGQDSFCQTWSHWYMYLRMQGLSHQHAQHRMHQKKLDGLKDFSLYIYEKIQVNIGRKRYSSLKFMRENKVREINSLVGDATDFIFHAK